MAAATARPRPAPGGGAGSRRQVGRLAETIGFILEDLAREGTPAYLEKHHGIRVPDEMLQTAVDLAVRYVPNRYLPDKALDLLDEACAAACLDDGAPQPI
mgnify:CR=1 FL=1